MCGIGALNFMSDELCFVILATVDKFFLASGMGGSDKMKGDFSKDPFLLYLLISLLGVSLSAASYPTFQQYAR